MTRHTHHRGHRSTWRLTPLGLILLIAFVVLIVLALVAPSAPVYAGLALVMLMWALALNMNFPSRGVGRSAPAARQFDEELRASDRRRQGRL